ncbi:VanZ family protein [Lactobacillus gigeriorum]|uniref:Glycopeptide antibiotics resistance protein n=1 Tax=Lactobacillus gigeriorum DSM 23908 = CRBIP 24.85 TaxID=1423751 RepID=I7KPB2_9LACO|nr:VanZ family protein [Lactobacillus gigeriorum]KRN14781.1 glycopeptide antibiotics resistance protein [Lactobacillus gigeriorum DSM 23908 = CRBIP 24.85]CCI87244.1 Putative membrane protein [Lactobacillus gigeriorum DSM 23908 = CRBIP 24.85]
MLFLEPIYFYLVRNYATTINHFALIKLALVALDKTIFYFLIFAIGRLIWLLCIRHRRTIRSEAGVWIWAFYLILLFMFTTFRKSYFPWQISLDLNRPLNQINLVFMKETWKLIYGQSRIDFLYNSFGNVLCFVPIGILTPIVFSKKMNFIRTLVFGIGLSLIIESLQFVLDTGVTDIDDVFFNTCGLILGYVIYKTFSRIKNIC